ncbi:MAG: hypothetical protein U5O69_07730 [Candidatus Competibacteraceae bacterium]|nr:hypothetical protein [Candidatus Competibacteraceae bacterium]
MAWSPHPGPLPGERTHGATDPVERARLRAELDGLIAHLYGLTEAEFAHILGTFPLVAEPVKIAALNAYRDVEEDRFNKALPWSHGKIPSSLAR